MLSQQSGPSQSVALLLLLKNFFYRQFPVFNVLFSSLVD